jgi:hypothetical protein
MKLLIYADAESLRHELSGFLAKLPSEKNTQWEWSASPAQALAFFREPQPQLREPTLMRIAVGSWSEEELRKSHISLMLKECSLSALEVIFAWAHERVQLQLVSPIRHDLGNLVVILLSHIMKLESIAPDGAAGLKNLHQRLTELYERVEKVNIPRF